MTIKNNGFRTLLVRDNGFVSIGDFSYFKNYDVRDMVEMTEGVFAFSLSATGSDEHEYIYTYDFDNDIILSCL